AELRAPLVERGIADAVLTAQLRDWAAGFGLLVDGDNLAVGKAGRLHVELSVSLEPIPVGNESLLARLTSGCCVARRCMASHAASSRLARACHASPSTFSALLR